MDREGEITCCEVAPLAGAPTTGTVHRARLSYPRRKASLSAQADHLCRRLESLVARLTKQGALVTPDELAALRRRLADLAGKWSAGVGGSDSAKSSAVGECGNDAHSERRHE